MRRSVRWAVFAVCLTGAVLFGILGSIFWKRNDFSKTGITLAAANTVGTEGENSSSDGITLAQAENIRKMEQEKENPVGFTAWREETARVTDEDGFRSTDTTLLRLCGTSEYLIPHGKILGAEDTEGCLLGESTAEQLFGSRRAEGLKVLWEGRMLSVRGVLREPEDILVVQETKDTTVFNRITLEKSGNTKERARNFKDSYGLGEMLLTHTGESRIEQVLGLVPGKWSDFSGWQANWESWREELAAEAGLEKSILELAEQGERRKAFLFGLGSGALLFCSMGLMKRKKKTQ